MHLAQVSEERAGRVGDAGLGVVCVFALSCAVTQSVEPPKRVWRK